MREFLFGLLCAISFPVFAQGSLPELGSGVSIENWNPVESVDLNIFVRAKHFEKKENRRFQIHDDTPGIGFDVNFKPKLFSLTPFVTYNNAKDSRGGRLEAWGGGLKKDDIFTFGKLMFGAGVFRVKVEYGAPDIDLIVRKSMTGGYLSALYQIDKNNSWGGKIIPVVGKAIEGAIVYQRMF